MALILNRPIAVLIVQDDEDEFLAARDVLASHDRVRFVVEWASQYAQAVQEMRQHRHDVYLLDYRLGERTGIELVREAFPGVVHAPVIVLTRPGDAALAGDATADGVSDFVLKEELTPTAVERVIRYAISHHRATRGLALSEQRYALALRGASDGIWDWDLVRNRIYLSPRWYEIVGLPETPYDEDPSVWFDLVGEDDLPRLRASIDTHLAADSPHIEFEHRIRHSDGSWRWVLTRGVAIFDPDGVPTRMAGSMSDITDRRNAEMQLEHDALHDRLTGLPNRALFMDRLGQALARGTRDGSYSCSVLFLDVDRFKLVNDSLSRGVGDRLLVALAGRLGSALRPGDTAARIGGDEFALLLDGVGDEAAAEVVARRVLSSLERPFSVDGRKLFLTASIGIALHAEASAAELLRNADIAMYDAKRHGRARWTIFNEEMHRRAVDRLVRENELRGAIETERFDVHYQPMVDLATGAIHAFEALARWPAGSPPLEPSEFIPIAEETGLIAPLGMQVLEASLRTLAGWRTEGLVDDQVYMSVNVSGRQVEDPAFAEQVRGALQRAVLPPHALRLELTESTVMQDEDLVGATVAELTDSGVRLHLDDFGTGYSSLRTLHRLPVEALKIDRSFVSGLGGVGGENEVIVRSTIALAHSLGLQVIAEGIEEPAQLHRLRTVGCEYGQGFLFSRPMSGDRARALLREWQASEMAYEGDGAA